LNYQVTEGQKSVLGIKIRKPRQGEQDNLKRMCGKEIRTIKEIE
jgi:hypothetical protein